MKKYSLASIAIFIAIMFCYAGVLVSRKGVDYAQAVTTATGCTVIFLYMIIFIYVVTVNFAKPLVRIVFASGIFMLLIEYISSVIYKINLNVYASIFWCDVGLIFMASSWIGFEYLKNKIEYLKFKEYQNKNV